MNLNKKYRIKSLPKYQKKGSVRFTPEQYKRFKQGALLDTIDEDGTPIYNSLSNLPEVSVEANKPVDFSAKGFDKFKEIMKIIGNRSAYTARTLKDVSPIGAAQDLYERGPEELTKDIKTFGQSFANYLKSPLPYYISTPQEEERFGSILDIAEVVPFVNSGSKLLKGANKADNMRSFISKADNVKPQTDNIVAPKSIQNESSVSSIPIMYQTEDVQKFIENKYPGYNVSGNVEEYKKIVEAYKKQGLDVPETDVIIRNQKIEKAQREALDENARLTASWAITDPDTYYKLSDELESANAQVRELYRKLDDGDIKVEDHVKEMVKMNRKRNVLIAEQEKLLDPDFKEKVTKIKESTNSRGGRPGIPAIPNTIRRSKLIQRGNDPELLSLSPRTQSRAKTTNARGTRYRDATVTFGSTLDNNLYSLVPNAKFNFFNPKTWAAAIGKPAKDYKKGIVVNAQKRKYRPIEDVAATAAHESGHDLQEYSVWIDDLVSYSDRYAYYINKKKGETLKLINETMVPPVEAQINSKGKKQMFMDTWYHSFGELHSELMAARVKKIKEFKKDFNLNDKQAIKKLKDLEAKGDDNLYKWYLDEGDLQKHFLRKGQTNRQLFQEYTDGWYDYDTYRKYEEEAVPSFDKIKKVIRIAPALIPGLFAAGAAANTEKQRGGEMFKTYRKYINGVDESKKAKNIYDKMNAKYYNESKQVGMSPANYIMTYVIPS